MRDRHSAAAGLWKFSATSRRRVCAITNTHTLAHTHTHNKENTIITFKLVNPDMLIERYCSILSGKFVYKLILQK